MGPRVAYGSRLDRLGVLLEPSRHTPFLPPAHPVPGDAHVPALAPSEVVAWREGAFVALRSGTYLPPLCAKCGALGVEPARLRKLGWHPSWVYALLLGGLVPYAIAAAVTTKRAIVRYYLCARHVRVRRWASIAAIVLAILGAGTLLAGCDRQSFALQIVGLAWIAGAGIAAAASGSGPLSAKRIDGEVAWVTGLHPDIAARLPDVPPAGITVSEEVRPGAPVKPVGLVGGFWSTRNVALLLGGALAVATALIVLAVAANAHRRVTFDNPTDVPLELRVDGALAGVVPPGARTSLDFEAATSHALEARLLSGKSIARDVFSIPDPGILERFDGVYDLSGQAEYALVTVEYCRRLEECGEPRLEPFEPGSRFFRVPTLTQLDQDFPREVRLDEYSQKTSRTHLCHLYADDTIGCALP